MRRAGQPDHGMRPSSLRSFRIPAATTPMDTHSKLHASRCRSAHASSSKPRFLTATPRHAENHGRRAVGDLAAWGETVRGPPPE